MTWLHLFSTSCWDIPCHSLMFLNSLCVCVMRLLYWVISIVSIVLGLFCRNYRDTRGNLNVILMLTLDILSGFMDNISIC